MDLKTTHLKWLWNNSGCASRSLYYQQDSESKVNEVNSEIGESARKKFTNSE